MAKGKDKKPGRKTRVSFRPNRLKPGRDKSWTRQFKAHGFAETDTVEQERVRAKGDLSRKRTIIEEAEGDLAEGQRLGIVTVMRGLIAEVDDGSRIWPCTVRRILRTLATEEHQLVAVGDQVKFSVVADEDGVEREGVIEWVAPRKGQLRRKYGQSVRTIVANVDQVVIVSSFGEPSLKPHLIDRYLVSAHAGSLEPVICLNKADLADPEELEAVTELYSDLGYKVLLTSAVTGRGIDDLRETLRDRKSMVAGQSGVGKSSLLNAVQPGLQLRVGGLSKETLKGKHTTSTAQLLRLEVGGYVVDTPGVRSYELAAIPLNELEMHFVEFVDRVAGCKFPNCTHIHEDRCAIRSAVEAGEIYPHRYESYVRMFSEYEHPYR